MWLFQFVVGGWICWRRHNINPGYQVWAMLLQAEQPIRMQYSHQIKLFLINVYICYKYTKEWKGNSSLSLIFIIFHKGLGTTNVGKILHYKYVRAMVLPYCNDQYFCLSMSEWLLFNIDAAIVQLYYGENKLIYNEMIMFSHHFIFTHFTHCIHNLL
jgi:hypothetical protein